MITAAFEHFAPHHAELRTRLIRVFIAVALTSTLAYLFIDQIAGVCTRPLFIAYPELERLVYTKLTEAFISYIKLAILAGLGISFPYIIYQAWSFISPGLLDHEQQLARVVLCVASVLFISGAAFAFFVVLPRVLVFFMSYAGETLHPMPKLGLYLTFIARLVLTFGIAFQIPFLMVAAQKAGLVQSGYFRKRRNAFYLVIILLAFFLTAGEPVATVLLSLPLFGLYEAGGLVTRMFNGKRPQAAA
ncbi:MAG: twin-arginine translocase subunit TatC [Desulfobulbus propionicus]|nr:MAG: twin-arginine translocase subunit TatC [Desulfobulbus propionicus]